MSAILAFFQPHRGRRRPGNDTEARTCIRCEKASNGLGGSHCYSGRCWCC